MRTKKRGFTAVSNDIIAKVSTGELSLSELGGFVILRSFADGNGANCWPKRATIASRAGVSATRIGQILIALVFAGAIQITRTGRASRYGFDLGASQPDSAKETNVSIAIESKVTIETTSSVSPRTPSQPAKAPKPRQRSSLSLTDTYSTKQSRNSGGGSIDIDKKRALLGAVLSNQATTQILRKYSSASIDTLHAIKTKLENDSTIQSRVAWVSWALAGNWIAPEIPKPKVYGPAPVYQRRTCVNCSDIRMTESQTEPYRCPTCRPSK